MVPLTESMLPTRNSDGDQSIFLLHLYGNMPILGQVAMVKKNTFGG
jgi:hypothetical protein